jgi:Ca-activated chloride channel homolog
MKHNRTIAGAISFLSFSLVAAARAQEPPSSPAIHVNVDRINVGVTVTDSHGHSVAGLRREAFRIFDNGVEQPLTGFASNDAPAQVVLLIESGAADYLLAKLGKSPFAGADHLLKNISTVDRVAVVSYSQRPDLVLDFTPDKLQARHALEEINLQLLGLKNNEGFGMLAINLASSLAATVDWLATIPGSKIILLISSGMDTSSPGKLQSLQDKLKTSDVRILSLSILGDFRKLPKHVKLSPDERENRLFVQQGINSADELLREITAATGGHTFSPSSAKDFDRAYAAIAQLVRGEYTLEFVPPRFDHQVHSLKIEVKHCGCHVDYRQAYLAPPPPAK